MRLLFVAADPMEFRGMLARASEVRRSNAPAQFGREARLAGHEALLVADGMGWKRAARAVAAGDAFRPEAVVSTGFCGALDERLAIADVVSATRVVGDGREHLTCPAGSRTGVIVSIDHVAQTALEKKKLRETGAVAVEMEAAAVARAAAERGIPFYCIRAVTDLAGETMANDFNGALREDGHLDTINVLRGALCRPTTRIPELLRLKRRCVRAAEALGEFFVGCRF
jgi:adenosylhomocysteine nucleosidase